jgi:NADPH2:quinone reductase
VYTLARGSYAEYHAVPAMQAVKIPDNVDDATAAACMLQGATAHYLTHSTFPLKRGQTTLIHAAAGGTGRLLVQIAAMIGARVIGTLGSEEKAKLAKSDGASETILYNQVDFVAETKRLTDGKGVEVVYDGVGKATLLKGLDCLKPRGMMVAFGNASGPADPVDLLLLSQKGSLYVTRPTLFNYIASREDLEWRMSDLFRWIGEGKLKINIDKSYPLAEAAQAHRDLEGRKTTGKLLLKIA